MQITPVFTKAQGAAVGSNTPRYGTLSTNKRTTVPKLNSGADRFKLDKEKVL